MSNAIALTPLTVRTGANLDGHPCRFAPAPRVTIDPETRYVTLTVARSAASRPE